MSETRELLLFAHDHSKTGPHPVKDLAALPKPFDLVAHNPEWWNWGKDELTNPWFRIVVWAGVSADELDALLSPMRESGGDPGNPAILNQYRGFFLSFGELGFAEWWADDSRKQPKFTLKIPPADIPSMKRERESVINPAFIGVSVREIG